jgi:flagellar protein FliO/FliZ
MDFISASYLVRWVLALLAVLLLMGGMVLLMQRLRLGTPLHSSKHPRRLKVLETLPVGQRHRVSLIQCDDQEHLVLLGPHTDTLLTTGKKK